MLRYCYFLLALISLNQLASAESELIELKAAADLWPPYIDESLPLGGLSVQIADAALRTQGYTVRNHIYPWARALEQAKQGKVDLILDAWFTQERSEFFMYSRPYIDGPIKFIKLKDDPFVYKGLSSLKGKTVGLVRDYGYNEAFLADSNYEPFIVTGFIQAIKMLSHNRIDLTLENEFVAKTRILSDLPDIYPMIEFVEEPLSNNYVYVVSGYDHRKRPVITPCFPRSVAIGVAIVPQ